MIDNLLKLIKLEKSEILNIYLFSIINGIVSLSLPLGIQAIVSFLFGGTLSISLIMLILMVVMGVFFNGILQYQKMKISENIQLRIMSRLAIDYTLKLKKLSVSTSKNTHLPYYTNKFFEVSTLQKGFSKIIVDMPNAMIQVVFSLILLSIYNSAFLLIGFILLLILSIIIRYTSPRGMETSIDESDNKYHLAQWLDEVANNLVVFKFARNKFSTLIKTNSFLEKYIHSRDEHFKILTIQYWAFIFFKTFITCMLLVAGAYLFLKQQLTLGQFIAAEIVIITMLDATEKLILNIDGVYDVLTSLKKINKLLHKEDEDSEGIVIDDALINKPLELSFDNFYTNKFSIDKLSIKGGNTYFIDETTDTIVVNKFIDLISGVSDVRQYEGIFGINNLPFKNIDIYSYRKYVAIADSDQNLLFDSLISNLQFLNSNTSIDEVIKISNILKINDFIQNLPKGLDTLVNKSFLHNTPNDVKNKLLLARVLLSDAKLVIIDSDLLSYMPLDLLTTVISFINDKFKESIILLMGDETVFKKLQLNTITINSIRKTV